jgi:hypothetical protein
MTIIPPLHLQKKRGTISKLFSAAHKSWLAIRLGLLIEFYRKSFSGVTTREKGWWRTRDVYHWAAVGGWGGGGNGCHVHLLYPIWHQQIYTSGHRKNVSLFSIYSLFNECQRLSSVWALWRLSEEAHRLRGWPSSKFTQRLWLKREVHSSYLERTLNYIEERRLLECYAVWLL